jgi:hypothetical protein
MRCIGLPQRQSVLAGSWRTSRRGSSAGSGLRLGVCLSSFDFARRPCCSISAATAAKSESNVSSSSVRCSALKASDLAANLSRLRIAFSCVSLSMTA